MKPNPIWPVLKRYDATHLDRAALPLDGICTGTISLGGRGDWRDWEIRNEPAKGFAPKNAFFTLWTPAGTRVLEGPIPPREHDGAFGCPTPNHGLPHFPRAGFLAAYSFGQVLLTDPALPVEARLDELEFRKTKTLRRDNDYAIL